MFKSFMQSQKQNTPPFNGFMTSMKFKSHITEVGENKSSQDFIDSDATHYFFHSRSSFITYEQMRNKPVKGATGTSDIVGRRTTKLPISAGMVFEAFHAPEFSSSVLSVRLLVSNYEIMFSESIHNFSACFFMNKGTFNIIAKYEIKDYSYQVCIPGLTSLLNRKGNSDEQKDLASSWHKKLGQKNPDRHFRLMQLRPEVPKIDRDLLRKALCVPRQNAKGGEALWLIQVERAQSQSS